MKISNLVKQYKGKTVLNIDNFIFETGKIYAIIGANGSGKSTLGKLLGVIIRPDGGKIDMQESKSIAYMTQNNYAFSLSTLNNVLLGSADKKRDLTRAQYLMNKLDLWSLRQQAAPKLSGGETAKMALARILLTPKDVVILDEPTASMDVGSTLLSESLIKEYHHDSPGTIILITHSLKQAMRMADIIIYMHDGKIAESGSVKEIIGNPKNESLKQFIDLYAI